MPTPRSANGDAVDVPFARSDLVGHRSAWPSGPAARELPVIQPRGVGCRLEAHLRAWLGAWPPARELELIVWPGREEPGWDGGLWPELGVESPHGTVLSLSPAIVPDPRVLDAERILAALHSPRAAAAVPAALGRPDLCLTRAAFRWSVTPAALPQAGEWVVGRPRRSPPAAVAAPMQRRNPGCLG